MGIPTLGRAVLYTAKIDNGPSALGVVVFLVVSGIFAYAMGREHRT